jgi:glycosyltransferase involved in cell wall biosynthesis
MSVSILMPVFNAGPYLDKCLNSILEQSFQDWELIAIDDHSTDDSLSKLCSFEKKDRRIKVFTNRGNGIIHALRFALQQSSGAYISRMDADDIMATHKIETLYQSLKAAGPGHLSTGLVAYFSDEELGEGYRHYACWLNELTLTNEHYHHIYKECVIPSPCWMIAKDDLIRVGAFEFDRYPEDYDLCFRFYQHQLKVIGNESLLHYWRDHGERASRNQEVYADNFFMPLKMEYFLRLDYDPSRQLLIWGAGKKGKRMAQWLKSQEVPFTWICNNSKKWRQTIYGCSLYPPEKILSFQQVQILVAVASPDGQEEIRRFAGENKLENAKDIFFFC